MFSQKTKQHLIENTCGWMFDIQNRVGSGIAWGLTAAHREFIELLEGDDGNLTLEEWEKASRFLMEHHAMARNEIYDGFVARVQVSAEGHEQEEWETVSRKEKDIRSLLSIYHTEYGREEE